MNSIQKFNSITRTIDLGLTLTFCIILGACNTERQTSAEELQAMVAALTKEEDRKQSEEQALEEARAKALAEKEKEGYFFDGMYKVGTDLPAGEYVIFSTSDTIAYYQLSKDATGSLDSIVSNDNFLNTRYLSVQDGEYLTIQRAKARIATDVPPQTNLSEGMYKVGKDIEPGEYKINAKEGVMGYIEVARDTRATMRSIVHNDNFQGQRYVKVKKGQYLKLARASIVQ